MSNIEALIPSSDDYMHLFMAYWNTDAVEAVDVINSGQVEGSADILAVDWRQELSRQQASLLLNHVGIPFIYPQMTPAIETPRIHRTGKQKLITDHLIAIIDSNLHLVERRLALPLERSDVVGSLFRVMSAREYRSQVRTTVSV